MAEKDPTRTPAAWKEECLRLLQEIHPDYRVNREVSGTLLEFVRPGPGGLLISQNFLRKVDTYYLSVALLFSPRDHRRAHPWLYHPLFAGARFDHNRTVPMQLFHDFDWKRGDAGFPAGLWAFGPWRRNTLPILARGLAANEESVIPHYLEALRPGRERLVRLFQAACEVIPRLDRDAPVAEQAERFGLSAAALQECHSQLGCAGVEALAVSRGGHRYRGFGPDANMVDLDAIPPELMVLCYAEHFLAESDRLEEMLGMARSF